MNIQKQIVTSANWDAGRGGHQITGIVLHTMVGTTPSAYSRFSNPASQVSVHYGVSLDGSIHQWVEEANTAYQAGNYPVNQATIGIEHEDNGNYNDPVRTDAEYNSSSDLVADICHRYNIPCDTGHIFRHHDVIDTKAYPGGTACPDGLDTNKIISMAQAKLQGDSMQRGDIILLYQVFLGRNPGEGEIAQFLGKPVGDLLPPLNNNTEHQAQVQALTTGQLAIKDKWSDQITGLEAQVKQLQGGVTKQAVVDYINKHLG